MKNLMKSKITILALVLVSVVAITTSFVAYATSGGRVIKLKIGDTTAYVDGVAQTMEAAPVLTNGRTMLPIRIIAESLGFKVEWDEASGEVTISGGELDVATPNLITIKEQGSFSVGGTVIETEGEYVSQNFDSWKPYPEGQTYHGDHASVLYQIPANEKTKSMVFLHGAGQSARSWQTTPDGRDGFSNIFLKRGFGTYLIDQPRRGQAGRSTVEATITPVADEQMWFEIWRMGHWPQYAKGVQFPQDEKSLEQFWQWMTPNTGAFDAALVSDATAKVFDKSGDGILVTHSQGGLPGWMSALKTDKVSAVVAYEPGNYLFPDNEVPEALPSRTGTLTGVGVTMEEFMKLTKIPIVIYFGDYIPAADEVSDDLGAENWRVRMELGRQFVEAVNSHGGDATLVELPKIGIYGNTHFLFAELNNVELADHLSGWMNEKGLDK